MCSFHCSNFPLKWASWLYDFSTSVFFFNKMFLRISKCLLIVKHVKYWCLVRTGENLFWREQMVPHGVKMMWLICFLYHVHKVMYKWPESKWKVPWRPFALGCQLSFKKGYFPLFLFLYRSPFKYTHPWDHSFRLSSGKSPVSINQPRMSYKKIHIKPILKYFLFWGSIDKSIQCWMKIFI